MPAWPRLRPAATSVKTSKANKKRSFGGARPATRFTEDIFGWLPAWLVHRLREPTGLKGWLPAWLGGGWLAASLAGVRLVKVI